MARKPIKARGRAIVVAEPVDDIQEPTAYPIGATTITALQVYYNPERKPNESGPWNDEADKVGWIDEESGMRCIMLRQTNGTLSGYVGVDPDHPFFGYEKDALPVALATSVHRGIDYSKACEENRKPRFERYTVCHVVRQRAATPMNSAQGTQDQFPEEDVWWLGFDTDHQYDLVPMQRQDRKLGEVYRDQAYVYAECISFARKLRAVGDAGSSRGAPTERGNAQDDQRGNNWPQLPRPGSDKESRG